MTDEKPTETGGTVRGSKLRNEYADLLGRKLYADTPKAVLAAIAVSLLVMHEGEEGFDRASELLIEEWKALHSNGIVPQKPPSPSGRAGD